MPVRNGRQSTLREAYVQASSFLRDAGVREPEANAQRLLEHVLGETRSGMLLRWSEPFPAERETFWRELLDRKAAGEPVQYLIGEQEFYGLPFTVTPAVLIPRPETELLVEEIARLGQRLWRGAPSSGGGQLHEAGGQAVSEPDGTLLPGEGPTVCDVGTGSGAIAVTLAAQHPHWRVAASDISSSALAVARGNAARHGVDGQIAFLEGDLLAPWIATGERLDILVSNPPYIPDGDEPGLQPEVRLYEPRTALYGGPDGLALYRRLIAQLAQLPAMPRLVGLEVGQGQAEDVCRLLGQAASWDEVRIIDDLAGIGRHVVAHRASRV